MAHADQRDNTEEGSADLLTAAPNGPTAPPGAAVPVDRTCAQLGEMCQQDARDGGADAWHAALQLVALAPERTGTLQVVQLVIDVR